MTMPPLPITLRREYEEQLQSARSEMIKWQKIRDAATGEQLVIAVQRIGELLGEIRRLRFELGLEAPMTLDRAIEKMDRATERWQTREEQQGLR